MNPNEERLKELQAEIEQKKAEIAAIKADDQQVKADEMASTDPTAEQMALLQGRGLTGNRDVDGNLITEPEEVAKPSLEEVLNGLNIPGVLNMDMNDGRKKQVLTDAALGLDMDRKSLVMSPEFQAIFGDSYDDVADPLKVTIKKGPTDEEIDEAADMKWKDFMDIDGNYRKDAKSKMMRDMGNPDQDRRMAMEDDIDERSMGFKADDGGNMSVDEKDDFWKTQEGYNKAMEMYGSKPAFVPDEPTLVFNPTTQEYEEIKDEDKEEFVDFSQPRMSADLKALLG
jgi:hypothetical protein